LPDLVPFKKAKRFITGQNAIARARKNFKKFVAYNRRGFDERLGKRPTPGERVVTIGEKDALYRPGQAVVEGNAPSRRALSFWMLSRQIPRWRKTGVPRTDALHLRIMFKDSWKEIKSEEARAKGKRRKQWEGDRVSNKLSKTFAKVA
jgi:hypothetical protein